MQWIFRACLALICAVVLIMLATAAPAWANGHCYRPQQVQALQVQQRVCHRQQLIAPTTVLRQQVYYQPQVQQALLQQAQPQQVLLQQQVAPQVYYQPRQVLQPTQQLQLAGPSYGCNGGQAQGVYYYQPPQQQQALTLPDTAPASCPQCQSQANLTLADTAPAYQPQQALTLADTAPSYGYAQASTLASTGYATGYQRTVLASTAAPGYVVGGQQVLLLQQQQHQRLLERLRSRHTVGAQFAPAPQQLVLAQDAGGYGVAGAGTFQQINVNTSQRRGLLGHIFH
jgi:hypothetical protein